MEQKIELPKDLHAWLASLKRSLRKLNEEDRDDILLSYVEQFTEELTLGKTSAEILYRLKPLPEIVTEIYEQFEVDGVIKIKDKNKKQVVKVKINSESEGTKKPPNAGVVAGKRTISVFSFLLSLGAWTMTFLTGVIAVLLPVTLVLAIILTYINFDAWFATSLAAIFFAILPFGGVLFFFLTKVLYRTSRKMTSPFKKGAPKKFGIKLWLILLVSSGVLSAMIGGIGVGVTYKDGFIDSAISHKYQHTQDLWALNRDQFLDQLNKSGDHRLVEEEDLDNYFGQNGPENKFYISAENKYWTKAEGLVSDWSTLRIVRQYNLKEDIKLEIDEKIKIELGWDFDNDNIWYLRLVVPSLNWLNHALTFQPETIKFIYE